MTDLTLDTAMITVRQAEDIAQQVSQQEEGVSSSVQEVTRRRPEHKKTWDERRLARERNKRMISGNRCGKYGKTKHRDRFCCGTFCSECRKCKKKGHYVLFKDSK